jgi:hypothetical protein
MIEKSGGQKLNALKPDPILPGADLANVHFKYPAPLNAEFFK